MRWQRLTRLWCLFVSKNMPNNGVMSQSLTALVVLFIGYPTSSTNWWKEKWVQSNQSLQLYTAYFLYASHSLWVSANSGPPHDQSPGSTCRGNWLSSFRLYRWNPLFYVSVPDFVNEDVLFYVVCSVEKCTSFFWRSVLTNRGSIRTRH